MYCTFKTLTWEYGTPGCLGTFQQHIRIFFLLESILNNNYGRSNVRYNGHKHNFISLKGLMCSIDCLLVSKTILQ